MLYPMLKILSDPRKFWNCLCVCSYVQIFKDNTSAASTVSDHYYSYRNRDSNNPGSFKHTCNKKSFILHPLLFNRNLFSTNCIFYNPGLFTSRLQSGIFWLISLQTMDFTSEMTITNQLKSSFIHLLNKQPN
jgi:hypothetical protein